MTARFIHLHCHSEYSLVDSLIRVKPFIKTIAQLGMPACAITDQSNLFALVKFYQAAQQAGIKSIVGVDVWLRHEDQSCSRLVLLCQNDSGYRNLTRLISRSYIEGQHQGIPYLQQQWLSGASDGLIALSGGLYGDIGQSLRAERLDKAKQQLATWQALFPQRFYLELQRCGRPQEEAYVHAAVAFALQTQMPVVATNDVRFLKAEDFEAHEVRVCIHESCTLADPRRPRNYSAQQYLRSAAEMAELFADIPEAIENTWLIAQRCNLTLTLGQNYLPDFPVPEGETVTHYFHQQSRLGLEQRLGQLFDTRSETFTQQRQPYDQRLARELDVIIQMGFPGYFLIVADFIQWAKQNQVPVGPGRGSGAGSLVAFALGITDLDPLRYDLLFERFLNPERVSMPDFDIDFCMEGRDAVIDYVAKRYGRKRVSQIITYGTMAAKAVVRDVGRVLGHPHGFVDKIAKLIPFELGITLEKALSTEETLRTRYEQEEEIHELIDMAQKLEGLVRNAGKHAGGVVIAPSVLTEFTPLYCEEDGSDLVTQFDKGDVETVGLVKFDFLGLRTLTIIKWALEYINHLDDNPIDITQIPLNDAATFDIFKQAKTTAVFQLESSGIKKLVKRLRPDCFEDIIALVALYRPGPLQSGMVDDFIDRKQGRARIEYPHPALAPILKPTYGVILYQEQVMQIAQVLAGYTLGGADLLRRAMGKKKPEEMAKQRAIFTEGAVAHGVEAQTATYIFDLMEKFAGYGFNKSHSAAYALISYQTAWLKAHYPAAFMAAVLSSDMDNTDKVVIFIHECRHMKLTLVSPNINRCDYRFSVDDEHTILYGLGAIKGVGESAVVNMVTERQQRGKFTDLFDFCQRIDLRKANRRVLEALIKAGALDALGPNRATLMASLENALKCAEQNTSAQVSGQNDLFSLNAARVQQERPFVPQSTWTQQQQLAGEKETLGHYVSGHPINQYLAELKQLTPIRLADVRPTAKKKPILVAGWVSELRTNKSRNGRMASMLLEDNSARLEVTIFSDVYAVTQTVLAKDCLLVAEGEIREDEFRGGYTMTANKVIPFEQARETYATRLELTVLSAETPEQLAQQLVNILEPYRQDGRCPVHIHYQRADIQAQVQLGDSWKIIPKPALIEQLKALLGEDKVKVIY